MNNFGKVITHKIISFVKNVVYYSKKMFVNIKKEV